MKSSHAPSRFGLLDVRNSMLLLLIGLSVLAPARADEGSLDLTRAIQIAQTNDPWLNGSRYTEEALEAEAISAGTLPDPRVSVMLANLPTNTFDFGQEAMTQLNVGVAQMFPRGDSRALMKQQKQHLSRQQPLLRADREAKVAATVSQLWLDAYKAQQSIRLIEKDRALFEQMTDMAQASYSSAMGRARQQDVIRSELELTRLEDRLTALHQRMEAARLRLSEWVGPASITLPLAARLPQLERVVPGLAMEVSPFTPAAAFELLQHHPALLALDAKIDSVGTGVELARQKYKPEWGASAQYGYRSADPMGRERADLLSVGVSFDLPLFTGNRQDKDLSAAVAKKEAVKTDKSLMVRQMVAALETSRAQLVRLDERKALYENRLLPQMHEQAEASLTAYNNDDGDFAEAVRARIAELNANIEALDIAVERQKLLAQINYLLTTRPGRDRSALNTGVFHD